MTKQRNRKRARKSGGNSQRKRRRDCIPTTVPFAATPRGETPSIDEWAHPAVWTDRMLTTLLEGAVRGGKWHTLNDKVHRKLNLYVVDADLKSYFDTIPKDRLMELVEAEISDSAVLKLIRSFLDQSIMEDFSEWTPEAGVPQGAVLSPVLSNVYLNPFDHLMAEKGFEMIRYADDFVILCRSQFEAEVALEEIREWVSDNGLTLHPTKTQIVDSRETSFSFLGYSFRGQLRFPRAKSHRKMMDRINELTPRKSGQSLECTLQQINSVFQGWFNYFRHCTWTVFDAYDARVRKRLRRMLLKCHRVNRQRLSRTVRWPNAYFTDHGFRSLREAHTRFVQSHVANY